MIYCTLKKYLDENKMTQSKASQLTGLTRPTLLQLIKNDNQNIRYETVEQLCALFHIKLDDLLLYSPVPVSLSDITLTNVKATIDEGTSISEHQDAYIIGVLFNIDNEIYKFDTDLIVSKEAETFNLNKLRMNGLTYKENIEQLENKGFEIDFLAKFSDGIQLDKLIKDKLNDEGIKAEFGFKEYEVNLNTIDKKSVNGIVEDIKKLSDTELSEFEYILTQYIDKNKR